MEKILQICLIKGYRGLRVTGQLLNSGATFNGIPNGTYVDAVTGDKKEVKDGILKIDAPGKGNCRVYVLNTEKTLAPGKVGDGSNYLK